MSRADVWVKTRRHHNLYYDRVHKSVVVRIEPLRLSFYHITKLVEGTPSSQHFVAGRVTRALLIFYCIIALECGLSRTRVPDQLTHSNAEND